MAKSSRWSQWIIAESADPRIQMPWTTTDRVRAKVLRRVPGVFATGGFRSVHSPLI